MLKKTISILNYLAERTSEIILFHSATGKDSIALLDLTAKYFKRVTCIYMYVVRDLDHVNRYVEWSKKKYNVDFIYLPHFANSSFIKTGYLGIKKDETVKSYSLNSIADLARKKTGVEWCIYGMKQNDGMNRRLMLRSYNMNAINEKTKNAYPLSEWSNSDVMKYIQLNNLIQPLKYNNDRSSGCEVGSIDYLLYLRKNYPNDLKKVIAIFPMAQQVLFEYDYHTTNEN